MALANCRRLYGEARYRPEEPEADIHCNVLYDAGGLYDVHRRLLPASAHFQGVPLLNCAPGNPFQHWATSHDLEAVHAEAPDDVYYWGGRMVSHYGHFILESLARLWMLPRLSAGRPKILVWGEDPGLCLSLPFIGDILRQVGLSAADIVSFDRPTRIRQVIVPAASFEGNHFVHEAYGRLCRSIADGLTQDRQERTATPVYIAKARLKSGTAHTVNEDEFAERLARAGISTFYPE